MPVTFWQLFKVFSRAPSLTLPRQWIGTYPPRASPTGSVQQGASSSVTLPFNQVRCLSGGSTRPMEWSRVSSRMALDARLQSI